MTNYAYLMRHWRRQSHFANLLRDLSPRGKVAFFACLIKSKVS